MSIPKRTRTILILLVSTLVIAAAILMAMSKNVTLVINGQSRALTTYALTVGSLLHNMDIALSPNDQLTPAQDAWLKNGATITVRRAIPIQILSSGEIKSFYSTDRIPSSLLKQADITIQSTDLLLSNGQPIDHDLPFPDDVSSIKLQIVPSVSFSITVDGESHALTSNAQTLGAALWAAGYTLHAADQLTPSITTPLTSGLSARLIHSHPVTIKTRQGMISIRTPANTVAGALADANLSLQGLDYSLPNPDQPIPKNGVVQVVRISEVVSIEQAPIKFETTYEPVADLELDSQNIVQMGEYGLTATRVRVRYADGQEISRQVENEWVAKQPVPRILGYGTLVTLQTEVVDGITIQYWRKLSMYATSYHPSEVGNTTASGLPLKKGVAAVDTNYIPFYTQMYIPGYGEAIAADRGGGVIGRWIDLGYSDEDYVPWHQWVTVYFLWPPPAYIVWTIP